MLVVLDTRPSKSSCGKLLESGLAFGYDFVPLGTKLLRSFWSWILPDSNLFHYELYPLRTWYYIDESYPIRSWLLLMFLFWWELVNLRTSYKLYLLRASCIRTLSDTNFFITSVSYHQLYPIRTSFKEPLLKNLCLWKFSHTGLMFANPGPGREYPPPFCHQIPETSTDKGKENANLPLKYKYT